MVVVFAARRKRIANLRVLIGQFLLNSIDLTIIWLLFKANAINPEEKKSKRGEKKTICFAKLNANKNQNASHSTLEMEIICMTVLAFFIPIRQLVPLETKDGTAMFITTCNMTTIKSWQHIKDGMIWVMLPQWLWRLLMLWKSIGMVCNVILSGMQLTADLISTFIRLWLLRAPISMEG